MFSITASACRRHPETRMPDKRLKGLSVGDGGRKVRHVLQAAHRRGGSGFGSAASWSPGSACTGGARTGRLGKRAGPQRRPQPLGPSPRPQSRRRRASTRALSLLPPLAGLSAATLPQRADADRRSEVRWRSVATRPRSAARTSSSGGFRKQGQCAPQKHRVVERHGAIQVRGLGDKPRNGMALRQSAPRQPHPFCEAMTSSAHQRLEKHFRAAGGFVKVHVRVAGGTGQGRNSRRCEQLSGQAQASLSSLRRSRLRPFGLRPPRGWRAAT